MRQVYLNGEFTPAESAKVSVFDRGYLFGDGVYEVIPVYAGKVFLLQAHLQRLKNSLAAVRIENPHEDAQWQALIEELIALNGQGDQAIYLQVTRGAAPRDHVFPQNVQPGVFLMSNPLKPVDASWKQQGIQTITVEDIRWQRCDIKAIALLANCLMKQRAQDAGAQEALLINAGMLTEGSASNAFVVIEGTLMTAPKSEKILPGITRDVVIELAHEAGIPMQETFVSEMALRQADEIWITSSTKEIVPVTQLDEQPVGNGLPGPVWQKMQALFEQYKARVLQ